MSSFVTIRLVMLFRSFTALGISKYASKDAYRGSIFVFAKNFRKLTAKLRTLECESADLYLARTCSRSAVSVRLDTSPFVDSHSKFDARSIQSVDFLARPTFRPATKLVSSD